MLSFRAGEDPAGAARELARALRSGKVVIIPTDTVYGLACDPSLPAAVARLFRLKGRKEGSPLALLAASPSQAFSLTKEVGEEARRLAEAFWPGALTLVLPRAPGVGWDLGGRPETIGVRVPDHLLPRALASLVGPFAATSANPSGGKEADEIAEAVRYFGEGVDLYVDGGKLPGVPSSVVEVLPGRVRVLREGAIPSRAILDVAEGRGGAW